MSSAFDFTGLQNLAPNFVQTNSVIEIWSPLVVIGGQRRPGLVEFGSCLFDTMKQQCVPLVEAPTFTRPKMVVVLNEKKRIHFLIPLV